MNGRGGAMILSRPHLGVGSGGDSTSLEILAYLRLSKGKQLFSLVSVAAACGLNLISCSQRLCHLTITIVLSIPL